MARKLVVEVVGDTSKLERSFGRASRQAKGFGRQLGALRIGIAQLAKATIVVYGVEKALEALHATIHAGIHEVTERAKVQAQFDAALKSTGNQAHTSAEQVDAMALSLSNLSGVDDEVIKSGAATLLTFTKVQNFAGRGNRIFDRATKASLNFSVKTGKSMDLAARAIGKALTDPEKAASSLRRAFVILTASEKTSIEQAVKHGDTLKAQRLILDAVDKRYGGQAKALGDTLPGKINVLRERLKDLAGDLGERLQGPLKRAVSGLADFVKRFSEAKGVKAKLSVVFEGVADLSRKLFEFIRDGIRGAIEKLRSVNWQAVGDAIRDRITSIDWGGIARAVRDKLAAVDWLGILRTVARKLSAALVAIFNFAADALQRVDWQRVGRIIVDALGAAIVAIAVFLRNVDWVALAKSALRLILAAFRAQLGLLLGVGREIGRLLLQGVTAGLEALGRAGFRLALKAVLLIIEPFTHLPRRLGGGWAQDLKKDLQAKLAAVEAAGRTSGRRVGTAITQGIQEGLGKGAAAAGAAAAAAGKKATRKLEGTGPDKLPPPPKPKVAGAGTGGLPDAVQKMIDRLQFNVDKAGATKTMRDDLAALSVLEHYLQAQLRVHNHNLDLERQLFDTQQKINDVLGQQRDAAKEATRRRREAAIARAQRRQFAALGLGPGGEDRVPGIALLKRQLAAAQKSIEGSILDTAKTARLITNIGKILAGKWGKVGKDVRAKIAEIIKGWRDELKGGGGGEPRTQFKVMSTSAVLRGLGLSPEQAEALRGRLASRGPRGVVPALTQPAFAGQTGPVAGMLFTGDVHVHGVTNIRELEQALAKRHKGRPHTRRGAR